MNDTLTIIKDNPCSLPVFSNAPLGDCDCACPVEFVSENLNETPVVYSLELVNSCNNRCVGCYNIFTDREYNRGRRSWNDWLRIGEWEQVLANIAPSARWVKLTGGEPSLHPDFASIVQAVQDYGLDFTLLTNGRWPDSTRLIQNLKRMSRFRGMLVSLHGRHPVSHEGFCGVMGAFDETVANITRAVFNDLPVYTSTVITSLNYEEIEEIVYYSKALKATCAVFNRYLGVPGSPLFPSREQLVKAISTIEKLIRDNQPVKYGNPVPDEITPNSSRPCLAGYVHCTIDPWGNVRPCNHSPLVVGNILEQSIKDIWCGEIISGWRTYAESLKSTKDNPKICIHLANESRRNNTVAL